MATPIARYLFNEAASGTTPTTVADDTSNNNTLTIDYSSGDAVWYENAQGRGLDFTAVPVDGAPAAYAKLTDISTNGTIGSSYNGITSLWFHLVVDLDAGHSFDSRIFQIGTDAGNGILALTHSTIATSIRIAGTTVCDFPTLLGLGETHVLIKIDTTQAVEADRITAYYNNVEQTQSNPVLAQNTTIDCNNTSYNLTVGNRGDGNRNIDGRVKYLEFFTGNPTTQEQTDAYTALAANDDQNWVAAPDVTAPVLSTPTGTKTGTTTATGTVTTDEGNGTLYFYASTNSSETAATIKASGSSQAVSATGVQNVSFTGLSSATTYYAHYVQDDSSSNESNAVSSSSFTTDAVARAITNIDGDNNVQAGQTGVQISGDFDASPVSQVVTLGGEALTVTNWTSTVITVTIPVDINLFWGTTNNQLSVTDDTGQLTLDNVTLSAPSGWETVTFNGTAPDTETTESFYEYAITDTDLGGSGFTMTANDVLAFESATGLTIDVQTLPTIDPPSTVTGSYKIWDESLSTWTGTSTYTIIDGGSGELLWVIHDRFKEYKGDNTIDMDNDTFEMRLYASTSNIEDTTIGDASTVTGELSGNGYSASSLNTTWVRVGDTVTMGSSNATFPATGGSLVARYAAVVDTSTTPNEIIAHLPLKALPEDTTIPDGNVLIVTLSNGIFNER